MRAFLLTPPCTFQALVAWAGVLCQLAQLKQGQEAIELLEQVDSKREL
jgi:hypothetical protein